MKRIGFLCMLLAATVSAFAQSEDETGLVPISEQLQDTYARTSSKGFLIDPQKLLRASEARERREFLTYHSSDSLIDLYVVLFKGDQLLFNPGDLSGHLLNTRADSKPAVVVHYFMGRPDRAQIHLSAELIEIVPMEEQGRALANAIERAQSGVSPVDELEKFMVQTSIRIYRMERLLSEGTASPAPLIEEAPNQGSGEQGDAKELKQLISNFWDAYHYELIGSCLLFAMLWWLRRWHHQRARYEFPDDEVEERLGGAHGAGVGAIISFGRTSPPPAAQLEKLKLH